MITNVAAFLGISILVIVSPGQDTALTIRNTLMGGRRSGIATAAGVSSGQLTWTIATSAGLAALLTASEPIFTGIRLAGAAYLVYLGLQALRAAIFRSNRPDRSRRNPHDTSLPPRGGGSGPAGPREPRVSAKRAFEASGRGVGLPYRQGLLSNLGNPKMVVFFSSLLPQFVTGGPLTFASLLLLGLVFCAMTFTWLTGYAVVVARIGDVLRRDRVRRAIEATTGLVLIGLGLRLATERR